MAIKIASLMLMLLCMAISTESKTIQSKVIDQEGKPIQSVSIVTNLSGVGTSTNVNGEFMLSVDTTVTKVTVSSIGYNPKQFKVDQIPEVITLESRFYPLSGITITADRAKEGVTPFAFVDISGEQIKRDYNIGDPPSLMNATPNFYSYTDGGGPLGYSYTQIRGFDDKRISAYINGVPLNDPEDQFIYWNDLPDYTSSIDDIQVQRGVGNSLYGDASFGGSINVVTTALNKPRMARITNGYGQLHADGKNIGSSYKQSLEYSSGLIDGRWAFSGRFSKQKSSGYREQSWSRAWAYAFSVARLDPKMTTELYLFGGPMNLHLTFLGAPRSALENNRRFNPLTYENETDNFNQPHYHLHNRYIINENIILNNTVYFIRGRGNFEQEIMSAQYDDFNIDSSFTSSGINSGRLIRRQSVAKYQAGWNPKLELHRENGSRTIGGSFYYFESDHTGDVIWAENLVGNFPPENRYYRYEGKKAVASLYDQEYLELSNRLSLQATAQLRYQTYSFDQEKLGAFQGYTYDLNWFFFSPRVGMSYRLLDDSENKSANIYANFAVSSRTPTDAAIYDASDPNLLPSLEINSTTFLSANDSNFVFGDPLFKSERVYDLEFGMNYRSNQSAIGVNLYWMNFSDEIINYGGINPSTGQQSTVNADGSFRTGIELHATIKTSKMFTFSGNLSLNRYRIKDFTDTLSVYFNNDPNTVETVEVSFNDTKGLAFPELLGSLSSEYKKSNLLLHYNIRIIGKQYMELLNLDSLAIDGHTVSSISAAYTIPQFFGLGQLRLQLSIDNLFDQKFEQSGYGWNYGLANNPGDTPSLIGEAEYYVASERSFFAQFSLEM